MEVGTSMPRFEATTSHEAALPRHNQRGKVSAICVVETVFNIFAGVMDKSLAVLRPPHQLFE